MPKGLPPKDRLDSRIGALYSKADKAFELSRKTPSKYRKKAYEAADRVLSSGEALVKGREAEALRVFKDKKKLKLLSVDAAQARDKRKSPLRKSRNIVNLKKSK